MAACTATKRPTTSSVSSPVSGGANDEVFFTCFSRSESCDSSANVPVIGFKNFV